MADQTLLIAGPQGQGAGGFTMDLVALGASSLTGDSPLTLDETGTDTGQYAVTRTSTDSGIYVGHLKDAAGNPLGVSVWFILRNATATYIGRTTPIDSDAAGAVSVSQTSIDAIAAAASPQVLLATTIDTLTSQTEFTLTAGSSDDGAYDDMTVIVRGAGGSVAVGTIAAYDGDTQGVQLLFDPDVFTMAGGDAIYIMAAVEPVTVRVEATLQSADGDDLDVSAWLEWRGRAVPLDSGDTCSIAFRELSADADLFTPLTESDELGATAIFEDVFRVTKSTPGLTDDRQVVISCAITHAGRTYTGKTVVVCLGG